MKSTTLWPIPIGTAVAILAATLVLPAATQGAVKTRQSQVVTQVATITAIDPATRHVVLKTGGESYSVTAGPDVLNFNQLKVGDKITATYRLETEYVLSKPNQKLPANTDAMIAARAAKGQMPGAAVASRRVVTGAVLGVDLARYTLKIVDKDGGQVHTIKVMNPENRAQLVNVKVGDYITAYVTESLMLTASRS